MGYADSLDYLYGLERFGIKLGLKNVLSLLGSVGNPHTAFSSVHVAGSSGKGSVCAFLDSVLRRTRYRVGLYTSPHLVRFNERIRVDGEEISDEDVVRLTEEIRPYAEAMGAEDRASQPTFFEFTTAMAFRYFQEQRVDLAVLEVGMGGRLDATNVVRPEVAVVTRIELEHTQYLGKTVSRIAREKVGIVKEGVPVWTVEQPALQVIERRCAELGAPLYIVGKNLHVERNGHGFEGQDLTFRDGGSTEYKVSLLGTYQAENAALAFGAVRELRERGWQIGENALRLGLQTAQWPARLELVHPFPTVVLDVTHTPEGGRRLAESLRELLPGGKIITVLGVLKDKDLAALAATLEPLTRLFILTAPATEKALPVESGVRALSNVAAVKTVEPVGEAVDVALRLAEPKDVVLVTGSLYTAGEAAGHIQAWRRNRGLEVIRRLKARYLPGDFATAQLETALGKITRETEDPFVVLISTVLSQRTADDTTAIVSANLFARYPTPSDLAAASRREIEEVIRPSNFYRTKARAIKEISRRIAGEYGGTVPDDFKQLLKLPLVGRKTANCVLVYGYGRAAIPVDVHCHRIPNRVGLIRTRREEETERELMALLPETLWWEVNELFVRHGQTTCKPLNPDCPSCDLRDLCEYYHTSWRK